MADTFVTEFARPVSDNKPRDLLAQLYREIGISAVAAALDVLGGETAQPERRPQQQEIFGELREHLAA